MIQDNKKIPKKIKDILIQNPHWITNDLDLLNQIIDSENKKKLGGRNYIGATCLEMSLKSGRTLIYWALVSNSAHLYFSGSKNEASPEKKKTRLTLCTLSNHDR